MFLLQRDDVVFIFTRDNLLDHISRVSIKAFFEVSRYIFYIDLFDPFSVEYYGALNKN